MGVGELGMASLVLCQLIFAVLTFRAIRRSYFLAQATNRRAAALQRHLRVLAPLISSAEQRSKTLVDGYKLETKLTESRKKLENPTTDLQEFIVDMLEEGCGLIRIQPSAVFIRGIRK